MAELNTFALLDGVDVGSETKVPFALAPHQVPATLSCKGVADSAEDIAIQKAVSTVNTPGDVADGDFVGIEEGGTAKVLNGDNNFIVINGPGVYRIVTADVAYASDDVTVIVDC